MSTATATGDWGDFDAAVLVGASRAEMAIVEWGDDGPGRRKYLLTTVREDPGELVLIREGQADGSATVRLQARVGRWGDKARERRLMDAVGVRLEELAGVDYSPLPEE